MLLLHPTQAEFLDCRAKFAAFVGGIGSGKSFVICYDLIKRVRRGGLYMVIAPTYPVLRDSTLRSFFDLARRLDIGFTYHKTENRLEFKYSGAEVLFRSADNPETLRGPNLSAVLLDEASLMPKDVYDISIGRLRQGSETGYLRAAFTPKGPLHWTYSVFVEGGSDTKLFRAKTRDNIFLPEDFADTVARQYGDSPFGRQELEGEFVSLEGATFPPHWLPESLFAPAWPEGVTHSVLYLDPSQGKDAKGGDAQAYCRAGFWPGPDRQNLIYLECHANREDPPAMVARGVRLCRERLPTLWAYEVTGTLGFLEAEVSRQVRESSLLIRTWPVNHTAQQPKDWRIRSTLMPYLSQGRIRIVDNPGGRQLRNELLAHPSRDAHDDCADAAAGGVALLETIVAGG